MIEKIMEREAARKNIEDFKLKICGVDLEKICSDEELIESVKNHPIKSMHMHNLENAVMCGLVYFDEEKGYLCQKLIHPLKSGDLTCDIIEYKYELDLNRTKGQNGKDTSEIIINMLSLLCGRPKPLIGKIKKQDVDIAAAIIDFFDF